MMVKILLVLIISTYCFYETVATVNCNEAICASVVSKCMLTQSCNCDLSHRACCKDCKSCLNYLFNSCCSCVDMCPGSESTSNDLLNEPYTEYFREGGVPQLFYLFMNEQDVHGRWTSKTLPIPDSELTLQNVEHDTSKQSPPSANCTFAQLSQCLQLTKCKSQCESLGSSGFRWFRSNECCECIGENCEYRNADEKECNCMGSRIEDDISEDNLNYGEDMDSSEFDS